ncbi:MAG TPA: hypothetical protein ENN77_00835, partial [Candidatus Wirthbacteria bacterium]|nr:hypothetical protein [Candidatus Wirthbacteria bacterium]
EDVQIALIHNTILQTEITTLANSIDDSQTSFAVQDASSLRAGDSIQIDDEIMTINEINTNTLTVTRGDTPEAHDADSTVDWIYEAKTRLTETITDLDLTITVEDARAFANSNAILVGHEIMTINGDPNTTDNTIPVNRGDNPVYHYADEAVYLISQTTRSDPNGYYAFNTSIEGAYFIASQDPALTGFTSSTIDTLPSLSVDENGYYDEFLSLSPVSSLTNQNFGDWIPGSVSGLVFNDLNRDGLPDPGETGIAGVTVTLADLNSSIQTTLASNLPLVSWIDNTATPPDEITLTDATGFPQTGHVLINNELLFYTDKDANTLTGITRATSAASPSIIEVVRSLEDNGQLSNDLDDPTTYIYCLTSIYEMENDSEIESLCSEDITVNFNTNVSTGSVDLTWLPQPSAIGYNIYFRDSDTSSRFIASVDQYTTSYTIRNIGNTDQEAEDPEPARAQAHAEGDSVIYVPTITTTTDFQGRYSFNRLPLGEYYVMQSDLFGYISTGDMDSNSSYVDLISNSLNAIRIALTTDNPTQGLAHFGDITNPARISGISYLDANGNRVMDADESGIPNVTIHLYRGHVDATNRANYSPVATVETDTNGYYVFENVLAGNYTIYEDHSSLALRNYYSTTPDFVSVFVDAGGTSASNNFGNRTIPTGSISGTIWDDNENYGVMDYNEPGIAEVEVRLFEADGETRVMVPGVLEIIDGVNISTPAAALFGQDLLYAIQSNQLIITNLNDQTSSTPYAPSNNPAEYELSALANYSDNYIYLADSQNHFIHRFQTSTRSFASLPTYAEGNQPVALAIDTSSNRLFVANAGSNNIQVFDIGSNGTLIPATSYDLSPGIPQGLYFDEINNRLYVTYSDATYQSRLGIIDLSDNNIQTINTFGATAQLTQVYVHADHIYIIDAQPQSGHYGYWTLPSTNLEATPTFISISTDTLTISDLVAVSHPDRAYLYLATSNNRILVINPLNHQIIRTIEIGASASQIYYDNANYLLYALTTDQLLAIPLGTTHTDTNGFYIFEGVATPANYVVREIDLDGYISTTPNTINVTILENSRSVNNNFGDRLSGSISGIVYHDADPLGEYNGEPGIPGVTISLVNLTRLNQAAALASGVDATATTALLTQETISILPASGFIRINDEIIYYQGKDGNNLINLLRGQRGTTPATHSGGNTVHLLPDDIVNTYLTTDASEDAETIIVHNGAILPASGTLMVGDEILTYFAKDGNDLSIERPYQDAISNTPDEHLSDTPVYLLSFTQLTTDQNGAYLFSRLPAGSYAVLQTDRAGFDSTTPNLIRDLVISNIDMPDNLHLTDNNFGDAALPSSVSGLIYFDRNGNGTRQTGEDGFPLPNDTHSITINLHRISDTSIAHSVSTYLNAGLPSDYSFTDVPPGSYYAQIDESTLPENWVISSDNPRPAFELTSYGQKLGENFGIWQPTAISGVVFEDQNLDRQKDPGEPGIPNVTMTLADLNYAGTISSISSVSTNTVTLQSNASIFPTSGLALIYDSSRENGELISYTSRVGSELTGVTRGIGAASPRNITIQATNVPNGDMSAGTYTYKIVTCFETGIVDFVETCSLQSQPSDAYAITLTQDHNAVSLSWDPVPDALNYIIYRQTNDHHGRIATIDATDTSLIDELDDVALDNSYPAAVEASAPRLHASGTTIIPVSTRTTKTTPTGHYSFLNLPRGWYRVLRGDVYGYYATTDFDGLQDGNNLDTVFVDTADLIADDDVYFGLGRRTATISGLSFDDLNANGHYDGIPTDNVLSGVRIELYRGVLSAQEISSTVPFISTNTNIDGTYTFENIFSGAYTIYENHQLSPVLMENGYISTTPDIRYVFIEPGISSLENNFGNHRPARGLISGIVFDDNGAGIGLPGNGVQDGDEPDLPGVRVELRDDTQDNPLVQIPFYYDRDTITIDGEPIELDIYDMVTDENERRFFLSNSADDSIIIVRQDNDQLNLVYDRITLPEGSDPRGMALDAHNNLLYVAGFGSRQIFAINLDTHAIDTYNIAINQFDQPIDLALDNNSNLLVVFNNTAGALLLAPEFQDSWSLLSNRIFAGVPAFT